MSVRGQVSYLTSITRDSYRVLIRSCKNLIQSLSEELLESLPAREGKLDDQLKTGIRTEILTKSVILKTFNSWTGHFVGLTLFLLLTGFGLFAGWVLFYLITMAIPVSLPNIVSTILDAILVLIAILLIGSFFTVLVSNSILALYIISVVRYGIRRGRKSLQIPQESNIQLYEFSITSNDDENDQLNREIHRGSLVTFTRATIYTILTIGTFTAALSYDILTNWINNILQTIPKEAVKDTGIVKEINNLVDTIDYILPFSFNELLSVSNIRSLLIIVSAVFLFSVFINIRKTYQKSKLSGYNICEYDEFSFDNEMRRFRELASVVLYQLLQDDLREEYETIRGDILTAILIIIFCIVSLYMYAVILLENI